MADITRNTVSNIEIRSDTSLSTAVALARALALSLDNVFKLTGGRKLNPEEFTLMQIFHELNDSGKNQLLDTAKLIGRYDSKSRELCEQMLEVEYKYFEEIGLIRED